MLPPITVQSGSVDTNRQTRAKSWLKFDLPLEEPSTQSLIPVVDLHGSVYGFLPISPAQTFAQGATSGSVTVGSTTYDLRTVTLPDLASSATPSVGKVVPSIHDHNTIDPDKADNYRDREIPHVFGNREDRHRLVQYVALVLTEDEQRMSVSEADPVAKKMAAEYYRSQGIKLRTLQSLPGLISIADPKDIGYFSFWSMPVRYIIQRFNRGAYINSLIKSLDITVPASSVPNPPVTNGSINWVANLDPNPNEDCEYLDFNWIALFKTSPFVQSGQNQGQVIPVRIDVVSQPAGGEYAAKVLQSSGQSVAPGGVTYFDTIRILCLEKNSFGTFEFKFNISYSYSPDGSAVQSVPATLTLNVPNPTA